MLASLSCLPFGHRVCGCCLLVCVIHFWFTHSLSHSHSLSSSCRLCKLAFAIIIILRQSKKRRRCARLRTAWPRTVDHRYPISTGKSERKRSANYPISSCCCCCCCCCWWCWWCWWWSLQHARQVFWVVAVVAMVKHTNTTHELDRSGYEKGSKALFLLLLAITFIHHLTYGE
mgnify:CR=1 FL=1